MAEAVAQRVRQSPAPKTHIFLAAPNAFSFFLGQHQRAIGTVTLYEWDFERLRGGGYSVSLSI
jgi:hypothetical protein